MIASRLNNWLCRHNLHSWRWINKDSMGRDVYGCRHCHVMGTR